MRSRSTPADPAAEDAGGIYVHFPFCRHRCFYCDFNVTTPARIPGRRYTDAVIAELAVRASDLSVPARSLYFGGGTPSLWDPTQVAEVVVAASRSPGLTFDAEVTLEANPADITPQWASDIRAAGVNRLSVGVQALRDPLLRAVDRRHDLAGALAAVAVVRAAGFLSFSLDFMFGLPGQSSASWRADLDRVIALGAPHLSVYNLTVEPPTPLARQVRDGLVKLPADDAQAEMLFGAREALCGAGYGHYEVSSYALPGHRAVHNSGYWEMRPYLGLGAGAHGFALGRRWSNLRRVPRYVEAALQTGRPTDEEETPDALTLAFDRLMTGLRQLEDGVDITPLGALWAEHFAEPAQREIDRGRLTLEGTRLRLTEEGLRWMNPVLVALMPID